MNMSETQAPLRFERVRNFGRIFSDTRRFVRENFGVFFKTILFLVGPVALLTCTLSVFYQVNLMGDDGMGDLSNIGSYLALTTIITQLRWVLNGFVTVIVVSHFVKVYREKGAGKFDVGDVTRSIFKDVLGNLLAFVVLFFIVSLISVIVGYLIYGLAQVSVDATILFICVGWLGYVLVRYPVWYFIFSVFFARTSANNTNVFNGMALAGKAFSGNWWNTWAICFCMWMVLNLVGVALSMPANVATFLARIYTIDGTADPEQMKLLQSVLLSLGEFAKTIINSIFCVSVALHYFSLREKVDGEGTKKIVEMIGSKQEDEGIELTY